MTTRPRRNTIAVLQLPERFALILLVLGLILALGPYLSGADFGIFKIPQFDPALRPVLKLAGPIVFLLVITLFVPIWPGARTAKAARRDLVDGSETAPRTMGSEALVKTTKAESDLVDGSETAPRTMGSEAAIKKRLGQHQDNLRLLMVKKAEHAPGDEPVGLLRKIEGVEGQIEFLKEVLAVSTTASSVMERPLGGVEAEIKETEEKILDLGNKIRRLQNSIESGDGRWRESASALGPRGENLKSKWVSHRLAIEAEIRRANESLIARIEPVEAARSEMLAEATDPATTRPLIARARSATQTFRTEAEQTGRSISSSFEDVKSEMQEIEARVDAIEGFLTTKFAPAEGETALAAAKAKYEGAQGSLFLTNRRLIFEQKEFVVVKRKWLVVPSQRELLHDVLMEKELHQIQTVHHEERALALFGSYLYIEFSGWRTPRAEFSLRRKDGAEFLRSLESARNALDPE